MLNDRAARARYDRSRKAAGLDAEEAAPEAPPAARPPSQRRPEPAPVVEETGWDELVETEERLFREDELVRGVMIGLASAHPWVRIFAAGLRVASPLVILGVWQLMMYAVPDPEPHRWKPYAVILLAAMCGALTWIAADVFRWRHAQKYREYAEQLVRRRRASEG